MSLLPDDALQASFSLRRGYLKELVKRLKRSAFKRLTRGAMPIFFKAKDIISTWPLANGEYEPDVTELIAHYAKNRYSDFFIDVGANIGLTAVTVGSSFDEIHMFEPNPECVSILKVNARISLKNYTIHPYGLGLKDSTELLEVPANNWGGAFINEKNNSYGAENLKKLASDVNASSFHVEIRSGAQVFASLFQGLSARNKKLGVIKIDVEGYESIILEAIADTIPVGMRVLIVFEDLMQTDFTNVLARFKGRGRLFQIQKKRNFLDTSYTLDPVDPRDHADSINMVIVVA